MLKIECSLNCAKCRIDQKIGEGNYRQFQMRNYKEARPDLSGADNTDGDSLAGVHLRGVDREGHRVQRDPLHRLTKHSIKSGGFSIMHIKLGK